MSDFEFRIIGDREVQRMLEELPARTQTKILRPLLAEGSRMLSAAEKAAAPRESGLLETALGSSKLSQYRSGSVLFVTAGVRRGFRRAVSAKRGGGVRVRSKSHTEANPQSTMRDPVKYAHIVSGGRKSVEATNAKTLYSSASDRFFGKSVREAAPNPFVDRAFESTKNAVADMITSRATDAIIAEAQAMLPT